MTITPTSTDHSQGPENAPITLIEYGDYECPYCGETYYTVKKLQQELGDKLRFIFRNYPWQELHPHAFNASLAVETAGLQGKFWEMYDRVFEHQEELDDASLLQYAREL
jgi:protein-disulfide isomerase